MLLPKKIFWKPFGLQKEKKRQQPCRLVFVSPEVRESSRLWVFKVICDTSQAIISSMWEV